jgi:hypothetical protein
MHYDSGGLTGSDHAVLFSGPAAAHARQPKRSRPGSLFVVRENQVPQGPDESSPVRSAGLAFLKTFPSRTGRSTNAGNR